MQKDTVVLAYSGGLDTSCILKWLKLKGYRVLAYVADVGQREDFEQVRENAIKTGADGVFIEDLKREFVTDYIFPAVCGNAVYEGRYLLGTSLARPIIAKRQIEIAQREGAKFVSHGATGKGNDQVRFELAYLALDPDIEIISPWKDREFLDTFKGRPELIQFCQTHNIDIPTSPKKLFSMDENLFHKSYESGPLEDPMTPPEKDMFTVTVDPMDAPDEKTVIELEFKDGVPVRVTNINDNTERTDPLELFLYLNEIACANGVGRIDIVENRFIGIKSRGVYETPGGTLLHAAHRDIEAIAMDKEVLRLRDMLAPKLAEIIYNGFWFSPEMDFLMAAIKKSQELIDGKVRLSVYKGNVQTIGRWSPSSLYNQDLASMDIEGGFNQEDSTGFIRINALRLRAHRAIIERS
ncbi:MAG TPA: argininosuccinate synthase [Myxococcales bacterium]|nr:argininosuccinate synthase [Deltaproteobacteria bacterium]HAA58414.1 argininosuccinate synthase [Myxococcales bacterium]